VAWFLNISASDEGKTGGKMSKQACLKALWCLARTIANSCPQCPMWLRPDQINYRLKIKTKQFTAPASTVS